MLHMRCPCLYHSGGDVGQATGYMALDHRGHICLRVNTEDMWCVCLDLSGHTDVWSGPQDTQACRAGHQKISKWILLVCRQLVPEAVVGVWNQDCKLQCLESQTGNTRWWKADAYFESVTRTVYSSCILPYDNYMGFSFETRNLDSTTKCLCFKCWLYLKSWSGPNKTHALEVVHLCHLKGRVSPTKLWVILLNAEIQESGREGCAMTRGVELGGRDVRKAKAGGHGIFSAPWRPRSWCL